MSKKKPPKQIWLQLYDDYDEPFQIWLQLYDDYDEPFEGENRTWCEDKINKSDVRYVHARVVGAAVKKYLSPDYIMDKGASPIQIQRKILHEITNISPESRIGEGAYICEYCGNPCAFGSRHVGCVPPDRPESGDDE